MTKLSTAISLLLGLLPTLVGCAGPVSEPPMPPQQVTGPARPMSQADGGEMPAAEVVEALRASLEPNEVGPIAPEQTAAAEPNEPNEPAAAETPEPAATEQTTESGQAVASEPNQTGTSEPNTPVAAEPNEPASIEPNEPTEVQPLPDGAQTDDAGLDGMASFYEGYAKILQEYVRTDGRVDYDSLRRKRLMLRGLLAQADELDPDIYQKWTLDGKLAFWIDVYNLKMLDIIARNYPIQSSWWLRLTWPPSDIRHIEGIWSNCRFIVMDEEFTLGAVEHRFFRKTFGDPRVFLAITYASRSSPPLRRTPYRGKELDRQLDEQVRAFLTDGRGFRIDRNKGVVYLSALFKPTWRGKEFVARYGTDKKFKDRLPETRAVLSFITRYLAPDDVYFLEVENYSLEYMNFDWRLNDASSGY